MEVQVLFAARSHCFSALSFQRGIPRVSRFFFQLNLRLTSRETRRGFALLFSVETSANRMRNPEGFRAFFFS